MLAYLQLIRPINCLMVAVAVFIGGLLVTGGNLMMLAGWPMYAAVVAAFLIAGAGNAINDYTDVEADRVNRPGRVIPSGRASKRVVLVFSIVLFAVGILLGLLINWGAFLIALFNSLILILYSVSFQHKLLLGNLSISYLVGSGFLFGGAAMGNIVLPFWLFLLACTSNMSREIVKDMEDMEGDKAGFLKRLTVKVKRKVGTISDRFGIGKGGVKLKYGRNLPAISAFFLVLTLLVSPVPYVTGILGLSYLMILIPTDLVFLGAIAIILTGRGRKKYNRASRTIKLGMLLGLIAFIVGVLL